MRDEVTQEAVSSRQTAENINADAAFCFLPAAFCPFIPPPSFLIRFILFALLFPAPFTLVLSASAQGKRLRTNDPPAERAHESSTPVINEAVERAMSAVCLERESDPLGSWPIDEMQARPSLPLRHPAVVAGAERATRLLPVAKELAIANLRLLARDYKIASWRVRAAARHIASVRRVEPDMDLRDNAIVYFNNPRTIYFGTIFLAGLKSDDSMISVLAHELTHVADGRGDTLAPLFTLIGRRVTKLVGLRLRGRRPEELTCDLVGTRVTRSFIARTPNDEPLARRLARSVEHNCVEEDDTDEYHLSPRNTMRALLALDPDLARDITSDNTSPSVLPFINAHPQPRTAPR